MVNTENKIVKIIIKLIKFDANYWKMLILFIWNNPIKRFISFQLETKKDVILDKKYCGKSLNFIEYNKENLFKRKKYAPIKSLPYHRIEAVFKYMKIESSDVIVDVGSGKGRFLLFLAIQKIKNKLYGIELNTNTASFSQDVLQKYKNIEIINYNVLDFFPNDATIIYMYNPFHFEVMKKFVNKQESIYKTKKNSNLNIYYFNAQNINCFDEKYWDIKEYNVDGPTLAIIKYKKG